MNKKENYKDILLALRLYLIIWIWFVLILAVLKNILLLTIWSLLQPQKVVYKEVWEYYIILEQESIKREDIYWPIVCIKKWKFHCLNATIYWLEISDDNNIYLYTDNIYRTYTDEKWELYYNWIGFLYGANKTIIKNYKDIPDLIKLSDKIEYFNSKDFEWVSEKDKEIFEKIIAEASTEGFNLIDKIIEYKNLNK